MKKQDILSIIITFAFGLLGGMFLYMTGGAASLDNKLAVPEEKELEEKVSEFAIVSDVYGGCREACPSFQILNDGSYRYYRTPAAGAEPVLRQGTLPLPLQRQLRKALVAETLERESLEIEPSVCNSFTDGIDVKYEITLDGEKYEINSCGTAVDDNGVLWTTLSAIWDYFETGGNN